MEAKIIFKGVMIEITTQILIVRLIIGTNYDTRLEQPWASLVAQIVKNLAYNAEDLGSTPGLGRSPGRGQGYLPSILAWRFPMDRGA